MATVKVLGREGREISVNTGLFINNEFVPSFENHTIDTVNPANGKWLATVSAAQSQDVDRAVAAAQTAYSSVWKSKPPQTRAHLLIKLSDLIERDRDDLATLAALDAGALYKDTQHGEIEQSIAHLHYYAGWVGKITGKVLDGAGPNVAYTRREPLGVCAAIVPWNAPLMVTIWKLAPAIAAGNVIIIKTPELAPLCGQKLAQLICEAGFPPGVINILCGLGEVAGQCLAAHDGVRKIAFTGSTATGRKVLQASASSNLKKVTLELGGKGASIVFADANLENALNWAVLGITLHNGQICAAGSRILVHKDLYEVFCHEFHKRSRDAVHGDPLWDVTTKGPVISRGQQQAILERVKQGVRDGGTLLHGGEAISKHGYFIENTAFIGVDDDAAIVQEEVFGPVAVISPFSTEEEAIERANKTIYGLSAAVFTSNIDTAARVTAALECGQVTVNAWGMLSADAPFGGVKQSGFGRDGGEDALEGWTSIKTIKYAISP